MKVTKIIFLILLFSPLVFASPAASKDVYVASPYPKSDIAERGPININESTFSPYWTPPKNHQCYVPEWIMKETEPLEELVNDKTYSEKDYCSKAYISNLIRDIYNKYKNK
ncbi:hypothetical protein [Maridesulfovibrio frigidus]|uniref:hypothetical protein n=1 Tax=Maridesulfovibrio frigidus TaxID=340956 RepID=UPI0004E0FA75|nr:hypothetical protein [Maridesulfovibrio frigidus]